MSLAFVQCFSKVLFVYKEFCDCENGMLSIVAFKTLDISQGSVAKHLRCGGIFSDSIITNFHLILTMKKIKIGKSVNIW